MQKTEISLWEEHDFALEIDFHTNKALHWHWRMGLGIYHMLMRKRSDKLWSKLSKATTSHKLDNLGGRLREVRV